MLKGIPNVFSPLFLKQINKNKYEIHLHDIMQITSSSFNNLVCSKVFLSKMCRCNRMNFSS